MAGQPLVAVEGLNRLRRDMKRAGHDLGDLTKVHKAVGAVVRPYGQSYAPRRTGALAKSVRVGAAKTNVTLRAGSGAVPYANPIHWGWRARGIPEQPWLLHAARNTEPQWIKEYEREIDRLIDLMAG